ncbi:MAG TPA: hypothetical protein VLA88_04020, partial [Candidatus Saccharimonadales bacterium]|nr:hypothetical protein [Candidatus Saccharimonadales bacterium]
MSVKKGLFISRRFFAYAIVSGAMVLGTLFAFMPVKAATGINKQINFQGRLLNQQGATVADGYYNVQFKIYQDGTGTTAGNPGGTLKWTETFLNNNSQGVQVKNGFMSVQLGSVNPFGTSIDWNQDTLWLSINIGDTNLTCTPFSSCTPDGEMIPMKRLSSVPYALNSGQLGGLTGDQFVQIGQGVQGDATNNSSIFINKTGTGNLLELQDSGASALTVNNTGDITFGAAGNHTLSVDTAAAGVAGKSLTVTGGNAGTGAVVNGGDLLLQGGTASGTGITGS